MYPIDHLEQRQVRLGHHDRLNDPRRFGHVQLLRGDSGRAPREPRPSARSAQLAHGAHRAQMVRKNHRRCGRDPPGALPEATRAGQLRILMSRDRGGLRAQDRGGFEQLRNDLRPDARSFSDRRRPEVEDHRRPVVPTASAPSGIGSTPTGKNCLGRRCDRLPSSPGSTDPRRTGPRQNVERGMMYPSDHRADARSTASNAAIH